MKSFSPYFKWYLPFFNLWNEKRKWNAKCCFHDTCSLFFSKSRIQLSMSCTIISMKNKAQMTMLINKKPYTRIILWKYKLRSFPLQLTIFNYWWEALLLLIQPCSNIMDTCNVIQLILAKNMHTWKVTKILQSEITCSDFK